MTEPCVLAGIRASSVDFVIGVPDSGLAHITNPLVADPVELVLVREDAAVGAAVGAVLAGRRPLVFLKNAGLGAATDAVVSLLIASGLPTVLLVGWAGSGADHLPHHVVWGERTLELCDALGLAVLMHATPCSGECSGDVTAFVNLAFERQSVHVIAVSP